MFTDSLKENGLAPDRFQVILYGSLAATGKGHLTDKAILDILTQVGPTEIIWKSEIELPTHPNAMTIRALFKDNERESVEQTFYSIGGGDIITDGQDAKSTGETIYDMTTIHDILSWCEETGRSYWEYVALREGPEIWDYLGKVWDVMVAAVERGIEA